MSELQRYLLELDVEIHAQGWDQDHRAFVFYRDPDLAHFEQRFNSMDDAAVFPILLGAPWAMRFVGGAQLVAVGMSVEGWTIPESRFPSDDLAEGRRLLAEHRAKWKGRRYADSPDRIQVRSMDVVEAGTLYHQIMRPDDGSAPKMNTRAVEAERQTQEGLGGQSRAFWYLTNLWDTLTHAQKIITGEVPA